MRQYVRPEGLPNPSRHYFTADGQWGTSDRVVVIDTTRWTPEEWQEIETALPWDRFTVARNIRDRIAAADVARAMGGK